MAEEYRDENFTDDAHAKDLLRRHGELGNFMIKVQHRKNGTWQGKLTWVDEGRTVSFRSVWEMIKLMENALGEDTEEDRKVCDWN